MPSMSNPKHEAFAYGLAKGQTQREAYVNAGYESNDSAASRLAASPVLKDRVAELKVEINQKINEAMAQPNEETFGTLAEMGLTMAWCAEAFKSIYAEALHAGQLAPANTAVANIQKLIEIEGTGKAEEPVGEESMIKVGEVNTMLGHLSDIMNSVPVAEPEPKDITPSDVDPVAIIQQIEGPSNDDDHSTGTG